MLKRFKAKCPECGEFFHYHGSERLASIPCNECFLYKHPEARVPASEVFEERYRPDEVWGERYE